MQNAPLHSDVADGPPGGAAYWLTAADGLRLRVGLWPCDAARGTVLMFPGRTEYIEKYGPAATEFAKAGLTTLAIDWRGQGLADRMLDDRLGGHVMRFTDYQMDVNAMLTAAAQLDLPRPYHLLGHSMGGAIGLRALMEGLDVATAAFSSPMWGITIASHLRPFAWSLSWAARRVGLDHHYAPGTSGTSYANTSPFADNLLTEDPDQYAWMARQTEKYPDLALGGPSLRWLNEALADTRRLSRRPAPRIPCLCILGSDEKIVDPDRIHQRMARWPNGHLLMIEGGRHETMHELAPRRDQVFTALRDHFTETKVSASGEIQIT